MKGAVNKMTDFIEEKLENDNEDFVFENNEDITFDAIPISKLMVGIAENVIGMIVKNPEKKQELMLTYERNTLPVLDMIKFDEAFARKFLSGKGLSDEAVIGFGLGYFAIQTVGVIVISFSMNKKEVIKNENNDKAERESNNKGFQSVST